MFSICKILSYSLLLIHSQDKDSKMDIENKVRGKNEAMRNTIDWKYNGATGYYSKNAYKMAVLKMPYVNCNRIIFLDTFIMNLSLLNNNDLDSFIVELENVISKATFAICCLNCLIDLDNIDNHTQDIDMEYSLEFLKSSKISSKQKRELINELIEIKNKIKYKNIILFYKERMYKFIYILDKYVFEDFKFSLFPSRVKTFSILKHIYTNHNGSLDGAKNLGKMIIEQYILLKSILSNYKSYFSIIKKFKLPLHILTPLILKDNIIFKLGLNIHLEII